MLEQMLLHKWYIALFISGLFTALYGFMKKRGSKKAERFLSNFIPLALALLVSSLLCIILEFFFEAASLVAVVAIAILSPIFERALFGVTLKKYLPSYLASTVAGAFIEVDWAQKGLGAYSHVGNMLVVIFFGYFLFYYFAHKIGDAFSALGGT